MPKVMTTRVYQYDELPTEKAKKTARDWYKQDRTYEYEITTELEQLLAEAGIIDANIRYSLGYCQGDGASFVLKERMDLEAFERQQRLLVESIKTKKYLHWEKFSTMGGDQVPDDLKVGETVHLEYRYKDVDDQGRAIKNVKGGYSTYRTVWRAGDPAPPGFTFIKQSSPATILQIEKDQYGDVYLMRSLGDDISEAALERLRDLRFSGLATLQQLLNDEVDIVVSINNHSTHYVHWNTTSVHIETYSHGKRHDEVWQAAKEEDRKPNGQWDKDVIDKLNAHVDALEMEVDTNIDLFCRMLQEWVQGMGKVMERAGYDMIEAEESDENVAENLRSNDYWFTDSGSRTTCVEPDHVNN